MCSHNVCAVAVCMHTHRWYHMQHCINALRNATAATTAKKTTAYCAARVHHRAAACTLAVVWLHQMWCMVHGLNHVATPFFARACTSKHHVPSQLRIWYGVC
jgi:predicted ATPase